MQLTATALSHFSRKVRLVLDHYGLDYDVVNPGDVADADPADFADNPLMSVPVLRDGPVWLIDADAIAAHVTRRHDPGDRFGVLATDPETLAIRAVMNGVMTNDVKLILAARTGTVPQDHAYFRKAEKALRQGLDWLEARAGAYAADAPGYQEFHLVALYEHLAYYELIDTAVPRLAALVEAIGARPLVKQTSPFVLAPKTAAP